MLLATLVVSAPPSFVMYNMSRDTCQVFHIMSQVLGITFHMSQLNSTCYRGSINIIYVEDLIKIKLKTFINSLSHSLLITHYILKTFSERTMSFIPRDGDTGSSLLQEMLGTTQVHLQGAGGRRRGDRSPR